MLEDPTSKQTWKRGFFGFLLLGVLASLAYAPVWNAGFIWDDDKYVHENPLITDQDGLERIWWSRDHPSQYFPLVYTSFRFEHALWGFNPRGYHAINVLLHVLNASLLGIFIRRLFPSESGRRSAFWLSVLFLIHPIQVESVAWITERKNTLSMVFFLLSALVALKSWSRSSGKTLRDTPWYFSLILFALALLSKTTACVLPIALTLILWMKGSLFKRDDPKSRPWRWLSPYFLLALASGILTLWWEQAHQGLAAEFTVPSPLEKIQIAGRGFWFYLQKIVYPYPLLFSYPKWVPDLSSIGAHSYWLLAALGLATLGYRRAIMRGVPWIIALFYVFALAPLLGFVSAYTFYYTYVADHYVYIASIAPLGALAYLFRRLERWHRILRPVPWIIVALLTALTHQQARQYKDSEAIWKHVLKFNPASFLAHTNLGNLLERQGLLQQALEHARSAWEIAPDSKSANNLGSIYLRGGLIRESLPWFNKAIELDAQSFSAFFNLGLASHRLGDFPLAERAYKESLLIDPRNVPALTSLGHVLIDQGKSSDSLAPLSLALSINPEFKLAYFHRARGYETLMHWQEAEEDYKTVIDIDPAFLSAFDALGLLYASTGRWEEAVLVFEMSLRQDSLNPERAAQVDWARRRGR